MVWVLVDWDDYDGILYSKKVVGNGRKVLIIKDLMIFGKIGV